MSSRVWLPQDQTVQAAELLLAFAATTRRLSIACSVGSSLFTLSRVKVWYRALRDPALNPEHVSRNLLCHSIRLSPARCHQPTLPLTASLGRKNPVRCWVGLSLFQVGPFCLQLKSPLPRASLSASCFFLSEKEPEYQSIRARVFLRQDGKWYIPGQREICPGSQQISILIKSKKTVKIYTKYKEQQSYD